MGWSIGEFEGRDIGYGVPAECDHPRCKTRIDRGLSYVCGSNPYGQPNGCGLFFCGEHLGYSEKEGISEQLCKKCCEFHDKGLEHLVPFDTKPDIREWMIHKLIHESWAQWREDEPEEVVELTKKIQTKSPRILVEDIAYRLAEAEDMEVFRREFALLRCRLGFMNQEENFHA